MKKKAVIRLSALVLMSAAFCSIAFSGVNKQNAKKAGPIYHNSTCIYVNPNTGAHEPGVICITGFGQTCTYTTVCEPAGGTGPR